MISREEALSFVLQHEKLARRDFLQFAEHELKAHENVPATVRAKFILAKEQYGEFDLKHDWMEELRSEVWDGVMYAGLHRLKAEFLSPARHEYGPLE